MTYSDTVKNCIAGYPKLFETEGDVLHHLFFVNGNGYEWVNGELIDLFDTETAIQETIVNTSLKPKTSRELYPICQYAKIMCLPEDIKSDWLVAAQKAIKMTRYYKLTKSNKEYLLKARKAIKLL